MTPGRDREPLREPLFSMAPVFRNPGPEKTGVTYSEKVWFNVFREYRRYKWLKSFTFCIYLRY